MSPPSRPGAVMRGLAAGAIGTAAMDLLWFCRYKRANGQSGFLDWEFSRGVSSWEDAGAPAQMGRRLIEGVFQRPLAARHAGLVNDAMHWSYGLFWGTQYALVAASGPQRVVPSGMAFGFLVCGSDYIVLPLAKVYKPIWEYDAKTLVDDFSAHLVYGMGVATTFRLLCPRYA